MKGTKWNRLSPGMVFGKLTIMNEAPRRRGRREWACLCDCGETIIVGQDGLVSGKRTSCGCLGRLGNGRKREYHGMGSAPEYDVWMAMIARCYNPNNKAYLNYGSRGITVCEEWRHSFVAFFRDMGPRPSPDLVLDRVNNDLGYSKENCEWRTDIQSMNNMTTNRPIEFNGEVRNLTQWADLFKISPSLLHWRLERNWPMEVALTPPRTDELWQRARDIKVEAGSTREISDKYGVSIGVAWRIKTGRAWKTEDDPLFHGPFPQVAEPRT